MMGNHAVPSLAAYSGEVISFLVGIATSGKKHHVAGSKAMLGDLGMSFSIDAETGTAVGEPTWAFLNGEK